MSQTISTEAGYTTTDKAVSKQDAHIHRRVSDHLLPARVARAPLMAGVSMLPDSGDDGDVEY
jgi:hypothetical protein